MYNYLFQQLPFVVQKLTENYHNLSEIQTYTQKNMLSEQDKIYVNSKELLHNINIYNYSVFLKEVKKRVLECFPDLKEYFYDLNYQYSTNAPALEKYQNLIKQAQVLQNFVDSITYMSIENNLLDAEYSVSFDTIWAAEYQAFNLLLKAQSLLAESKSKKFDYGLFSEALEILDTVIEITQDELFEFTTFEFEFNKKDKLYDNNSVNDLLLLFCSNFLKSIYRTLYPERKKETTIGTILFPYVDPFLLKLSIYEN